jgi:hypothetical protein
MSRVEADAPSMALEAYGVPIQVTVGDTRLWPHVRAVLPPGAKPADPDAVSARFEIGEAGDGAFNVALDGQPVAGGVELDVALGVLDAQIRALVAANAHEWVFVHAGAVAADHRALLLPGASFTGKTTLVAALVRAGAAYYSDEFAVLDDDGLVHPYPKPLSIRFADAGRTRETAAEDLGASTGERPLQVRVIAVTSYRPGASWRPEQRPASAGALALLSNAVPARERPEQALHAVRQAAAGAITLEGERGEADRAATALLAALTA